VFCYCGGRGQICFNGVLEHLFGTGLGDGASASGQGDMVPLVYRSIGVYGSILRVRGERGREVSVVLKRKGCIRVGPGEWVEACVVHVVVRWWLGR
jgi:hypothetical protein